MNDWQEKRAEEQAKLRRANRAFGGHLERMRAMYGGRDMKTYQIPLMELIDTYIGRQFQLHPDAFPILNRLLNEHGYILKIHDKVLGYPIVSVERQ